jgi:hypothetical protein
MRCRKTEGNSRVDASCPDRPVTPWRKLRPRRPGHQAQRSDDRSARPSSPCVGLAVLTQRRRERRAIAAWSGPDAALAAVAGHPSRSPPPDSNRCSGGRPWFGRYGPPRKAGGPRVGLNLSSGSHAVTWRRTIRIGPSRRAPDPHGATGPRPAEPDAHQPASGTGCATTGEPRTSMRSWRGGRRKSPPLVCRGSIPATGCASLAGGTGQLEAKAARGDERGRGNRAASCGPLSRVPWGRGVPGSMDRSGLAMYGPNGPSGSFHVQELVGAAGFEPTTTGPPDSPIPFTDVRQLRIRA